MRTPVGKNPINTPLINKLRRAKRLAAIFKSKLVELQRNRAEENINSIAAGSKTWWNGIKDVTGERRPINHVEFVNIELKTPGSQPSSSVKILTIITYHLERGQLLIFLHCHHPATKYIITI